MTSEHVSLSMTCGVGVYSPNVPTWAMGGRRQGGEHACRVLGRCVKVCRFWTNLLLPRLGRSSKLNRPKPVIVDNKSPDFNLLSAVSAQSGKQQIRSKSTQIDTSALCSTSMVERPERKRQTFNLAAGSPY